MKCPKCEYLGLENGHRCRNCGYDFSLLGLADAFADRDLLMRPAEHRTNAGADADSPSALPSMAPAARRGDPRPAIQAGRREGEAPRDVPRAVTPMMRGRAAGTPPVDLPLFAPDLTDDEPLISVPTAPRRPVAVRKTPELLRGARPPQQLRRDERSQVVPAAGAVRSGGLGQGAERFGEMRPAEGPSRPSPVSRAVSRAVAAGIGSDECAVGRRAVAATIDLGILLALDAVIVYFTLRMAGVTIGEWHALPVLPMVLFLTGVMLAYFVAFTAVGGQTIGKMAAQIRVVTDEHRAVRPGQAIVRTLTAGLSIVSLGAGFAPAVLGIGRALHDRVARTRVVAARSAE